MKARTTWPEGALQEAGAGGGARFNLPVMTRYAVGAKWTEFSDAEHQA